MYKSMLNALDGHFVSVLYRGPHSRRSHTLVVIYFCYKNGKKEHYPSVTNSFYPPSLLVLAYKSVSHQSVKWKKSRMVRTKSLVSSVYKCLLYTVRNFRQTRLVFAVFLFVFAVLPLRRWTSVEIERRESAGASLGHAVIAQDEVAEGPEHDQERDQDRGVRPEGQVAGATLAFEDRGHRYRRAVSAFQEFARLGAAEKLHNNQENCTFVIYCCWFSSSTLV